ncbi:hypothetical protein ACWJJH_02175 [Endozoicomonadaceae bacterium StTr2]
MKQMIHLRVIGVRCGLSALFCALLFSMSGMLSARTVDAGKAVLTTHRQNLVWHLTSAEIEKLRAGYALDIPWYIHADLTTYKVRLTVNDEGTWMLVVYCTVNACADLQNRRLSVSQIVIAPHGTISRNTFVPADRQSPLILKKGEVPLANIMSYHQTLALKGIKPDTDGSLTLRFIFKDDADVSIPLIYPADSDPYRPQVSISVF